MYKHIKTTLLSVASFLLISSVYAADEYYAPIAKHPVKVYFGDPHLHTSLSMDAGAWGNSLGLEPAYRFARGEEVTSSSGLNAKLSRPLDWVVIADHSDGYGFFPRLLAQDATAAKQTTTIKASMTAYSTAVGPSSSFRKLTMLSAKIFLCLSEMHTPQGTTTTSRSTRRESTRC